MLSFGLELVPVSWSHCWCSLSPRISFPVPCIWEFSLMPYIHFTLFYFYPYLRTYILILERRGGRERNIDARGKHQSVASHTRPIWGLTSKPRNVPWWGVEPVILWCVGRHSSHLSHTVQGTLFYIVGENVVYRTLTDIELIRWNMLWIFFEKASINIPNCTLTRNFCKCLKV